MIIFICQGITSAEKIAKEFQLDTEKASTLKERFENGEIFKEEDEQQKAREIEDKALFNDGNCHCFKIIYLVTHIH